MDAKYLVLSSPNGQLFYCGKNYDDWCNKSQNCKHYYIKDDNFKEFLKKAAFEIQDNESFTHDPMINFGK